MWAAGSLPWKTTWEILPGRRVPRGLEVRVHRQSTHNPKPYTEAGCGTDLTEMAVLLAVLLGLVSVATGLLDG